MKRKILQFSKFLIEILANKVKGVQLKNCTWRCYGKENRKSKDLLSNFQTNSKRRPERSPEIIILQFSTFLIER